MKAGTLRHSVTIKRPVATTNSYGEQTLSWVPVATNLRVGISPSTSKEEVDGRQIEHEITHQVRMRYRDDIGPTMRLYYGLRILEIRSVINVGERNREIRLQCVEVNDG